LVGAALAEQLDEWGSKAVVTWISACWPNPKGRPHGDSIGDSKEIAAADPAVIAA